MINIRLKKATLLAKKARMQGAALLVFMIILLLSLTLLIISLTKTGIIQQKISGNTYRAAQAFEAAQAGLSFGIVYLEKNKTTIVKDTNADGYIDSYSDANTTNVALSNGSTYNITYTNPTQNNFSLIQVSSTGASADGTASREVREQIYFAPLLYHYSTYPLYARGNASLAGHSSITNLEKNNTIISGGSVNFTGSSETVLSSGTASSAAQTLSDVNQNNSALSAGSLTDFFISIFGASVASIQNSIAHYYTSDSNANYSSQLNGLTNTSVWIDQTAGIATINGNTVIGSPSEPVLLIVNGDLDLGGSAQIYGFLYVSGNIESENTVNLTGGMVIGGNVEDSGNFTLTYDSSILSKLQENIGRYAVVPGSWNDFQQ